MTKLTPQEVQRLLNKKHDEGLSPLRVRQIRSVLRNALNQALRWALVTRNVAALSEPPKRDEQERTALTVAQARLFIQACHGDRLEALFERSALPRAPKPRMVRRTSCAPLRVCTKTPGMPLRASLRLIARLSANDFLPTIVIAAGARSTDSGTRVLITSTVAIGYTMVSGGAVAVARATTVRAGSNMES